MAVRTAMRVVLFVVLALLPFALYAAFTIPHAFTNGTVANADEVNANFDAIKDWLDGEQTQTIAIPALSTRAQIQAQIDAVDKHIAGGQTVTFSFADGTYTLDGPLVFEGFYGGGKVVIAGNTTDPQSKNVDQKVKLNFVGASTNGIELKHSSVAYVVRFVHILYDATTIGTRGVYIEHVPHWTLIDFNYFQGNGTASGTAGVLVSHGSNARIQKNFVTLGEMGYRAIWASRMNSDDNGSTVTSPTYGLGTHSSLIVLMNANQPTGDPTPANDQHTNNGGQFFGP